MLGVVDLLPGVKDDPPPFVVFREFGESSINATLYFWIDTSEAGYWGSLDAVVTGIKSEFDREGIDIPFPVRRVLSPQPLEQAGLG
jgi:small-conductance mechanosensitive channel